MLSESLGNAEMSLDGQCILQCIVHYTMKLPLRELPYVWYLRCASIDAGFLPLRLAFMSWPFAGVVGADREGSTVGSASGQAALKAGISLQRSWLVMVDGVADGRRRTGTGRHGGKRVCVHRAWNSALSIISALRPSTSA